MSYFNIRVYGMLVNQSREVLISDELRYGMRFTKFPGGGLKLGEGLADGLKREFMEECGIAIRVLGHIHTTDTYIRSAFNDSQVIGVYYRVQNLDPLRIRTKQQPFAFEGIHEPQQAFRWKALHLITADDLTFETDRQALQKLKEIPGGGWRDPS